MVKLLVNNGCNIHFETKVLFSDVLILIVG